MSSKHYIWSRHCLSQAKVKKASHMLYAMAVHELTQICLSIAGGSALIRQSLVGCSDWGLVIADKRA
jgi:hypothetical protein